MKESNPHKIFKYEKAGKDLRKLLEKIIDLKDNIKFQPDGIKYTGEDIKSSSILATSHTIKESFTKEQLEYEQERGRDMIDTFINKVFQLGYSVGYENQREENKMFREIVYKSLEKEKKSF